MVAVLIILGVLAVVATLIALTYNRLVTLRLACENSWSQIDVALKLRHDLVPRLAEAVAGYAGHEKATFDRVAQARSSAVAAADADPEPGSGPSPADLAARGAAEAELGAGIGRVVAVAEDYPDLRATENFIALQRELAEIEEKISITRRVYNDTVQTYNTAIAVFPQLIVARAGGFAPMPFFDAPVEAEQAPSIEGVAG